jgi:hypothetical protein
MYGRPATKPCETEAEAKPHRTALLESFRMRRKPPESGRWLRPDHGPAHRDAECVGNGRRFGRECVREPGGPAGRLGARITAR